MNQKQKNQEVELKLQVVIPEEWDGLSAFIKELPAIVKQEKINLAANYFDTLAGDLHKAKLAYRVRRENQNWVATVKSRGSSIGGLHHRKEWNVPVASGEVDLTVFNTIGDMPAELTQLAGEKFVAIVRTDFQREVVLLRHNASLIEIALDEGWIFAGNQQARILEVELELKAGDTVALFQFGALLAVRFALIVEEKSKFLRGLQLRGSVKPMQPKSLGKSSNLYELLQFFYAEWLGEITIDQQLYWEKITALKREIILSSEIEAQLIGWMHCLPEEKFSREKVAVGALILLCANLPMADIG